MKRHSSSGFTLVEMLTVMAVIAILTALIVSVNSYVQRKAAESRATSEIAAITAACEGYKADNGSYPRSPGVTEPKESGDKGFLNPREDAAPTSKKYKDASLFLYSALSGDADLDFVPDADAKTYFTFTPDKVYASKTNGKIDTRPKSVQFIQDPWGNSYGYSTAAGKQEEDYRDALRNVKAGSAAPDRKSAVGTPQGYNPTFDLWSTGGTNGGTKDPKTGLISSAAKWVKNW